MTTKKIICLLWRRKGQHFLDFVFPTKSLRKVKALRMMRKWHHLLLVSWKLLCPRQSIPRLDPRVNKKMCKEGNLAEAEAEAEKEIQEKMEEQGQDPGRKVQTEAENAGEKEAETGKEGEVEAGHEAEEKTVQEASIVALAMWKKPHLPLQLSIRSTMER